MTRQFYGAIGIILFSTVLLLLRQQSVVLTVSLLFVAVVKHKIFPIKKEWLWFGFIGVCGGLTEIFLVNIGGAWSYAEPDIFGVPLFMPLYWGIIGITLPVIYKAFSDK